MAAAAVAQVTLSKLAVGRARTSTVTTALFGLGAKKPSGSGAAAPQYRICVDCGYIYDGKEDFAKLPSSYKCPVCTSPKSKFKNYKGEVKGRPQNTGAAMQKRMKERQW